MITTMVIMLKSQRGDRDLVQTTRTSRLCFGTVHSIFHILYPFPFTVNSFCGTSTSGCLGKNVFTSFSDTDRLVSVCSIVMIMSCSYPIPVQARLCVLSEIKWLYPCI